MRYFSSRTVLQVSSELLFIAEAPLLELGQEDYVTLSDMSYISKTSEVSNKSAKAGWGRHGVFAIGVLTRMRRVFI